MATSSSNNQLYGNPGPLNKSLLYLNESHRARQVWEKGCPGKTMRVKRGDFEFWKWFQVKGLQQPVREIVDACGFGGVLDSGYRYIDHHLIHALVERWRPETHTFHLPVGECTVTLEDIGMLWGLPIEGFVVTGHETKLPSKDLSPRFDKIHALLGAYPPAESVRFNNVTLSWLMKVIESKLPEKPTIIDYQQRVRCVMLFLCASTLFPDSNHTLAPLSILKNLEDLQECAKLSWGSAALASLYRGLCKATDPSAKCVTGPMFILQAWTWFRISNLRPERHPKAEYNEKRPLASVWCVPTSFEDVPRFCLKAYRSQLTSLEDHEFQWRPYEQFKKVPEKCIQGKKSWLSDCYIVNWEVVEHHSPGRVLRQFGLFQDIPKEPRVGEKKHKKLHNITRAGKSDVNWENKHYKYIQFWNRRHDSLVEAVTSDHPRVAPGYMQWYMQHTVKYITNPTQSQQTGYRDDESRSQFMLDGITLVAQSADGYMRTPHVEQGSSQYSQYSQNMQHMYGTASQVLGMVNQGHHLTYQPHLQTEPVALGDTLRESSERRGRRGRRGRGSGRGLRDVEDDQPLEEGYRVDMSTIHTDVSLGDLNTGPFNYHSTQFMQPPSPSFFNGLNSHHREITPFNELRSPTIAYENLNLDLNMYLDPNDPNQQGGSGGEW